MDETRGTQAKNIESGDRRTDLSLEERIQGYARLLLVEGCRIEPSRELLINASVDCAPFVRMLTEQAYEIGCKRVHVSWSDERVSRLAYDHCPIEEFERYPAWSALMRNTLARERASILTIESKDPDYMKGVDAGKIVASSLAAHRSCAEFYDCLDFGKTIWCIAGAASPTWAAKVFPGIPESDAVDRLWEAILATARAAGGDAISAWRAHDAEFDRLTSALNGLGLVELHYTNSLGTDLAVGLPEGAVWHGGSGLTVDGLRFSPNIPTEEVYTSPDRYKVNGVVHNALPLAYQGNLIDGFWIRFRDGRAVEFDAETGRDVLASIIGTDSGSAFLGEAALVPYSSPIRQTGLLFYSTLYDENASCHLALGKSFPECVEGGLALSKEELLERGLNDSAVHVDFMIGTSDLRITGKTDRGLEVLVFEDGQWAL